MITKHYNKTSLLAALDGKSKAQWIGDWVVTPTTKAFIFQQKSTIIIVFRTIRHNFYITPILPDGRNHDLLEIFSDETNLYDFYKSHVAFVCLNGANLIRNIMYKKNWKVRWYD